MSKVLYHQGADVPTLKFIVLLDMQLLQVLHIQKMNLPNQSKIASHTDAIANLLRAKVPRAAIARILDCDVRTVDKLINNSEQLKVLL